MDNSGLGIRMKDYESRNRYFLQKRTPVIIRLDMKAGHTFTRGFKKPFDKIFMESMKDTMKYLCENIQGCVVGYTQSDEITLCLVDYQELETDCWFGYRTDKLTSVSASMATLEFNRAFLKRLYESRDEFSRDEFKPYLKSNERGALFDSRCFNLPKEEVTNCFYWRQLDATRNSIQSVGQVNFSHSELMNKSCNDIQDMLMTQKGINWNDLPADQKRGSCCIKRLEESGTRLKWVIDNEIPIFKGEDRNYIEEWI